MWRRESGSRADLLDDLRDLVDVPAVGGGPGAPLVAVDRAEVAVRVGPLVPDRDAAVLQPLDVGVAAQEPQQLAEDRLRVWIFLVVTSGKPARQVEAHLVAEHAAGAGAGAVALLDALVEDALEEIEVGLHVGSLLRVARWAGDLRRVPGERDTLLGTDGPLRVLGPGRAPAGAGARRRTAIAALAVPWFGVRGLPTTPRRVPLESLLPTSTGSSDAAPRVGVLGTSFGAEAALLLALREPQIAWSPRWRPPP